MLEGVEIIYDHATTAALQERITALMRGGPNRVATHLSDLLYCLLKAWGKHHVPQDQWRVVDDDDDPVFMWLQGLQFESLVSEGQRQRVTAYCFKCRAVSTVPTVLAGTDEPSHCPVCDERWLVGTPDYIVNEIIYEAKQTRKSQRRGPQDAPWWLEQIAGYVLMERKRTNADTYWGRLVVNWIMGDYGEKRKGYRPKPPRSALDVFIVRFPQEKEWWQAWEEELLRRKAVTEGPEPPPFLNNPDVPRYEWECPSCSVGEALSCPNFVWDEEDRVRDAQPIAIESPVPQVATTETGVGVDGTAGRPKRRSRSRPTEADTE